MTLDVKTYTRRPERVRAVQVTATNREAIGDLRYICLRHPSVDGAPPNGYWVVLSEHGSVAKWMVDAEFHHRYQPASEAEDPFDTCAVCNHARRSHEAQYDGHPVCSICRTIQRSCPGFQRSGFQPASEAGATDG